MPEIISPLRVMAGLWWMGSVLVLLVSFAGALLFPRRLTKPHRRTDHPPITAITPIKSDEPDFRENLESLFRQSYPELEIVIAAAHADKAALKLALAVRARYPFVRSSIEPADSILAASPKLNSLWVPVSKAKTDLVLTRDSNAHLAQDDIENFVGFLTPDVGLVSTILVARGAHSPAGWIETSIINGYQARVLMLTAIAGIGFGCGKIMLFRRSDLERAGGLPAIADALGEDAAIAHAMRVIGLRTVFADRVSYQSLGARRLAEVWNRQLRWMVIRRVQVPVAFLGEFLGLALPTAIAGAVAAPFFYLPAIGAFSATLALWLILETALSIFKGWRISLWSPLAFLGREILLCAAWLRALTTSEVVWAGTLCHAEKSRKHSKDTASGLGRDRIVRDGA